MAMTDTEMLELVEQVIKHRLQGDGYNGYTAQQNVFQGESLDSLFKRRDALRARIQESTRGTVSLIDPIDYR
jgi:hypothetical protein